MDFIPSDYDGLEVNEKHEKFFRFILTREVPEAELENIKLRYIPDYIREMRLKKVYWGKEYRKWHDDISLNNWKLSAKQLEDEVKKHKIYLRNLDQMRRMFVWSSDDRYFFTQSMDPERVEALVSRIKENECDDNIILDMLNEDPVQGSEVDFTDTFYVVYASCARYGEFRIRPSQNGEIKVKEQS